MKVEEKVEVKVEVERGGGAQGKLQNANIKVQNGGEVEVRSWMLEARTLSQSV